jgi:cob(I)alamin adenosyltransferase
MGFKIYTKTGDSGNTGLFGGKRVSKADLRVETYGAIDELNAFCGSLRDQIVNPRDLDVLAAVQARLFSVGAYLASDPENPMAADLHDADVSLLEQEMDDMDRVLPPLRNFILPGGHPAVSAAHLCRTVTRRAERLAVALHAMAPVDAVVLQYLNRLSDYFFVLSRKIAHDHGVPEVVWKPR